MYTIISVTFVINVQVYYIILKLLTKHEEFSIMKINIWALILYCFISPTLNKLLIYNLISAQ